MENLKLKAAKEQFSQSLMSLIPFENSDFNQILDDAKIKKFETLEHLYFANEPSDHMYFVCSGLVRMYYVTSDGEEMNKSFHIEGRIVSGMYNQYLNSWPRFSLQALEPTNVLCLKTTRLKALFQSSIKWANLGLVFYQQLAQRKESREASFLLDSPEQRYLDFLEQEPELAERLPNYHLASYIGVKEQSLSRIRRRLKMS